MAVYANLFVDQGTDFMSTINLEGGTGAAFGLEGYTIRAQMRKTYTSSRFVQFEANITEPVCRSIEPADENKRYDDFYKQFTTIDPIWIVDRGQCIGIPILRFLLRNFQRITSQTFNYSKN